MSQRQIVTFSVFIPHLYMYGKAVKQDKCHYKKNLHQNKYDKDCTQNSDMLTSPVMTHIQ